MLAISTAAISALALVGQHVIPVAARNGRHHAQARATSCAAVWGQCGGLNWSGPTCCISGTTCTFSNDWYSQCLPNASSASSATGGGNGASSCTATVTVTHTVTVVASAAPQTTSSKPATTTTSRSSSTTTVKASSSVTTSTSTSTNAGSTSTPSSSGFLGGVNIAGYDFGIDTSGNSGNYVAPPASQIGHFAKEGVNVFRFPFGWQYMVSSLGGSLNPSFFSAYDAYIQQAISSGAYAIIDVHNYARWNGGIIGQGGPSNAQFVSLWTQLATKYASQSKVIFGIMNEPHDLDINTWSATVQAVVNAIRAAGAKTQIILLPGTGYTGAGSFLSTNEPVLSKITDPVGGTKLLYYDIHQYYDSDSSGQSTTCVTDHVTDLFTPITAQLTKTGRKAFLSETGGGSTSSCETYVKNALAYIKGNSNAWAGFTAWAAGSFDTSYALSLTPTGDTDTPIWNAAIKPNLP